MPKATFFNLPEEKKRKIIAAAHQEFSRVSLYDASIANIIKEADIPRGSFYQYFENKEDIFFLVLRDFKRINIKKLKDYLEETKGDLLESFILLYEYLLQSFKCEENKNFFKNAFLNMNHKLEQQLSPLKKENKKNKLQEILNLLDTSKLNLTKVDVDEFEPLFKLLMTLTMSNVVESFARQLSLEESKSFYEKQIKLLKEGIYKQSS